MSEQGNLLLQTSFADVDHFCDAARLWDLDFAPLAKSPDGDIVADLFQARYGQVDFGSSVIRSALMQAGAPPAKRHTFVLLPPTMNDLWWRHQFVSNNNILVFHEGADLNCLSGPDFNNFCLSIDETYVERVAEREHIRLPALHRRPEVFRPAPALYARALHLAQACVLQASEATVSAVTDITDHLTVSWVLHAGIHQGARHERAHERALRQSLELIGDTPHQQHTVAELCRIAGTSRRTLETAFRDHLGVSPAAFMKLRRLSGARQDLKRRTSNSARVGDIMARHGFSHVGQFATDYRAAFGERPSDTLNNVN